MAKKFRIKGDQDISKITPLKIFKVIKDGKYHYYPSKPPKQNALYITSLNKDLVTGNFVDEAGKIKKFDLNNRKQFKEFRNLVNKYRNDENIHVPDYVSKVVEGQSKRLKNKRFRIKDGNKADLINKSPVQLRLEDDKSIGVNVGWKDDNGFIGINGLIDRNNPNNGHLEAHYSESGNFKSFDFRNKNEELEFDKLLKKSFDDDRDMPDWVVRRIKRREENGGFDASSNKKVNSGKYRIKGGAKSLKEKSPLIARQLEDGSIDAFGVNDIVDYKGTINKNGKLVESVATINGGNLDQRYNLLETKGERAGFKDLMQDASEKGYELPHWVRKITGTKGKPKVSPEPIPEPVPESIPEPPPIPEIELTPEPEPVPEPKAEPKVEPKTEPVPETKTESKVEQKAEPKPEVKSTEDVFNDKLDKIEEMYNEGKLTDKQYTDSLNNLYNSQKPDYIFNEKLDSIEEMYNEGGLTDDEYADALNKLYDKERQSKKATSSTANSETVKNTDSIFNNPKTESGAQTAQAFDHNEVDPRLHFNQTDYKKYKMHDIAANEFEPSPLTSEEKWMKRHTDYIEEYEAMKDLVGKSNLASEEGARNYEKVKNFFGEDQFSIDEAKLRYDEAKFYTSGRKMDDAWWDERTELIKRRRAINKGRQEYADSIKATQELEDTKFIQEVAANRDIRKFRETKGEDFINGNLEYKKAIENAEEWLNNPENVNRYYGIPEEFRDKVEGDIKRSRFELRKAKRNAKLDADYAGFKARYDELGAAQKEEIDKLVQLEKNYRGWQATNGKKGMKKGKGNEPEIAKDIEKAKERIKELRAERKSVKKDLRRTSSKTRDRAGNIRETIRDIKGQIHDNQVYDVLKQQYNSLLKDNPGLSFEQFLSDNYGNTKFKNFKPMAEHEINVLKDELQFHQDLLKDLSGIDIAKEEGDIVERGLAKLKGADKVNLVLSGITAIGQYKDSRKEGRSAISSAARAGADFAASQLMGAPLYMGLSLAKAAPKAIVSGGLALQNQVRQMNTASRFRVFGDANFQDNDKLATMRQSGMEMAKMANYNLEQTLMGNEARYMHR